MAEVYSNDYYTTLNGAINNSTTSLVVTSTTGRPTGGEFRLIIEPGTSNAEIVTVTSVAGSTFTISRATEAVKGVQTAFSHADGSVISHVLTVGSLIARGPTRLGKSTVGASFQASSGDSYVFMKKLTMPSDGILYPPTSYWKAVTTTADVGFSSSFWLDDGGSPSRPKRATAGMGNATLTRIMNTANSEFWLTPAGCPPIWVSSGQVIWAVTACHYQSPYVQIAYDTGGSDLTAVYSSATQMGETDGAEGNDLDSFTDSTRHFSIFCAFIPA